jgi:hypothetical protein
MCRTWNNGSDMFISFLCYIPKMSICPPDSFLTIKLIEIFFFHHSWNLLVQFSFSYQMLLHLNHTKHQIRGGGAAGVVGFPIGEFVLFGKSRPLTPFGSGGAAISTIWRTYKTNLRTRAQIIYSSLERTRLRWILWGTHDRCDNYRNRRGCNWIPCKSDWWKSLSFWIEDITTGVAPCGFLLLCSAQ